MHKHLVGIEIGGTKIQMVIADRDARVLNCFRFEVRKERGAEGIRERIARFLTEWKRHHLLITGIGVGFGGPVDRETGHTICSHQIQGWDHFDLNGWIQEVYGKTYVCVENDSNTAALGEALCGAGVGYSPVLYMNMGSGVGGGAVVDGKIYHGAIPGEIEIGHIRLDKTGRTVESCCSGWAVDKRIQAAIHANPDCKLAELCAGMETKQAAKLLPALQEKDSVAQKILKEVADDLAFALSHATHLIHPQAIVLGGGLSLIGEPLREAVQQALPQYLMDAFQPGPKVLIAQLGENVVPVGALELVKHTAV